MKKIILLLNLVYGLSLLAQKKDDKPNEAPKPATPAIASIADKTKKCKKINGLFTLYRDTTNGSVMMLIKKEQLDKEYIYFSYVENGNNSTGHNKGTYRDNKVFEIKKYYGQIEFQAKNVSHYFNPNNAIAKSANSNINNPVMSSEKIVAIDESKGEYLIEADNLFLSEVLYQVKTPSFGIGFNLGALSKNKTRYHEINNYPENTDIVVKYVYDDPMSRGAGSAAITDSRYVEVLLQHSFIAMPDNNFQPRFDDPRIGYFTHQVNDMTSLQSVNYRDVIHRWNLEKKDKNAAISEPVKPITWWIENTTPVELRPTIKAAILQWNMAFEKAGFKNAIEIKEQPDSATWHAGDIRYNVLRWTSSPEPPFGGYGPSFVNPRTGEILGADIMFEWVFLTNRLRSKNTFDKAGLEMLLEESHQHHDNCSVIDHLHQQNMLGQLAINSSSKSKIEVDEFLKEALYYLVLHEVGHTLGLNHNMKSTQLHDLNGINDYNKTKDIGLNGSVMDYPAINFNLNSKTKYQYFTDKPGPYDFWAIEFGYYEESSKTADSIRREKILIRSTEPALTFGNDADDMRSPGKAIDPRVMIGDMSSDAIGFARNRVVMIKKLQDSLLAEYGKGNQSYHDLRTNYLVLTSEWGIQAGVVSRYIGGVYVDRSFANQNSTVKPFTAVPLEEQKNAMKFLNEYVFSPKAFEVPTDLANYLQQQRRGFGFFSSGEDPKLHDRVLNIQKSILVHLLHPATLQRITDSKLYGNKYDLSEVLKDLTNAIFQADLTGNVNTYRQNLQIEYVEMLGTVFNSPFFDNISKARITSQLQTILKAQQTALLTSTGDTKEHRNFLVLKIKEILEKK